MTEEEKLKKENQELRVQGSIILLDYNILKDKIREKIEDLKREMENDKNFHFYVNSEDIKRTIITNLEELLEEE